MDNHYISLENREKATISKVLDVDAFDEDTLWANLEDGAIELTGESLNIEKLDLADGILVVSGKISSFSYVDRKAKSKGRFFKSSGKK